MSDPEKKDVNLSTDEHNELLELADASEDNALKALESEEKANDLQKQLDAANAKLKTSGKTPAIKGSPVKAVFTRDSNPWETGVGDVTYKQGEKVTFSTDAEYQRWHRRGACESHEDAAIRLKAEKAKKEADEKAAQGK